MRLTNSLTRSLLLHALLLALILLQIQRTKALETANPKKWEFGMKVVLQERELQLPRPAVKNAKDDNKHPVPAETAPVKKDAPAVDTPAQIMAKQLQQAVAAQVNAQFMLMHMNAFFKVARLSLEAFINNGITAEDRERLNGKTALVKLLYKGDGALKSVGVESESDELKSLLENADWKAVPLPSAYFLPYKGLGIRIAVQYGDPLIGINVLPEDSPKNRTD